MPPLKIQHIVSCSSEDTLHKANNLLNAESFRKWKCAEPGEKQASVILQLEKSSIIHSIDIGNESSAFIEVLVGHSTSDNPEDYQVILVTSSFMNPLESKNGSNANRVRMFGPDKLCKTALDKRWDRVKIVCTQPFNKHISYGISFIKLHSTPEEPDTISPTSKKMLGKFALKEETPSTMIAAGSFFKDRNKTEEPAPLKGAAAIRAASYQVKAESSATPSPRKPADDKPRQRTPAKPPPSASSTSTSTTPKPTEQKQTKKRKLSEERAEDKPSPQGSKTKKTHREEEELKEPQKTKFNEIMKGVTFVLSGYQNPYRGELRDKATKMGGKYEANWGPGCTHLICAFVNTPKYQQVHGKGKIVTKHWILDSYKKKSLQPWRRYKLSDASGSSSSEGESDEASPPPPKKRPNSSDKARNGERKEQALPDRGEGKVTKTPKKSADEDKPQKTKSPEVKKSNQDEDDDLTDVESIGEGDRTKEALGSDADTEDELMQAQEKNKQPADPFGESTDEEDINGDDVDWTNIPKLPDFFKKKRFFFYGKFSGEDRRLLHRFVIAFGGLEENYMSEVVDYVVTESKWDSNFDQALKDKSSLVFVNPKWLHVCGEKGQLVSHKEYVIQKN